MDHTEMKIPNTPDTLLPFWSELSETQKAMIKDASQTQAFEKGTLIHRTDGGCKGLLAVLSGQLRVYILSEEGREVTLYRIRQGEICVLAASCLMDAITFDVLIEATENTELLTVSLPTLNAVMAENLRVELYLYKAAAEKFSDVMWTMQQILFLRIDQRAAQFLWDEMQEKGSAILYLTHDEIAKYIGSAREVVTKVMKYLSQEGAVELSRGKVKILDKEKLRRFL